MLALALSGLSLLAAAFASPVPTQNLDKRQSTVPFGSVIRNCAVPGTVALTFDDGPYIYTAQLLDMLSANGVRATFFLNGANVGNIYDYTALVQRMIAEGHQVGSHTWSHADLTHLDEAGIRSQMTLLESAFTNILGYYPSYMRPPYAASNDQVTTILGSMGYHVVNFDIDTLDWQNQSPDLIWNSVGNFNRAIDAGARLSLAHDTHPDTVHTLAQQMFDKVKAAGLATVPVGECLGDAPVNWYYGGRK